jgi:hypothetical protein
MFVSLSPEGNGRSIKTDKVTRCPRTAGKVTHFGEFIEEPNPQWVEDYV